MPIWGVVNQKGGVGKTTTAVNLASGLAAKGGRVLLVDCDPQGNATTGFGIDKRSLKGTLADALANIEGNPETRLPIVQTEDGVDLVPATLDLAGIDGVLANAVGRELLLRDLLEPEKGRYDWIILDGPPSLGLMTINVLAASDGIVVPMPCEFYALEGISQLMRTVEAVRRRMNPNLKVAQVLLTMFDGRSKSVHQVADEVREFFGDKVAKVTIPRNVRLSESPSFGVPAVKQFPGSKGAVAYMEWVDEVMQGCGAA